MHIDNPNLTSGIPYGGRSQLAKMYNNESDRPVNQITIETEKDHYGTVIP